MTSVLKISLAGYDSITDSDKRHMIFDSTYNTFKVVLSGTTSFSIANGATTTGSVAHGLSYIPTFSAFLKVSGGTKVIPIGGAIFTTTTTGYYSFLKAYADATNMNFTVKNTTGSSITVVVKYYLFEAPL